jgi:penicillin-binding protein 1C
MGRRATLSLIALVALAACAVVFDRAFPPDLSRWREVSLEVEARDGEPLRVFTTRDGMIRLPGSLADTDPHYLDVLLTTEDRHFFLHPGVDPLALGRAFLQLVSRGHVVSGGSTLTMQVARLLAPHRHDLFGKFVDIIRALQLEARFTKREILTIYLTLAPMGGNLEGVRAASRAYFDKEPAHLNRAETALLVAIPQSPSRLRPDRHPIAAAQALLRLCSRNAQAGCDASAELPAIARRALALHAPHLADTFWLAGRKGAVRTTLDADLQQAVEGLARREASWLGDHANVAVLVVANDDRSILAYLGGNDYFGRAGMVDMVRALRSPGSTLKPFIYGLAFDESIIGPDTIVEDLPVRFGDYAPADFDRVFHGAVRAREALQQSYNSPAVKLLHEVGAGKFAATLRLAGARLAFPRDATAPGLPLALGGVGVTLRDLTMLYAGLATDGQPAILRLEPEAPFIAKPPIMTAASAKAVREILGGVPPPDGIAPVVNRAIAYKTGTSYGFRDALAVGLSAKYTVAVWVGRTEGTPRPGAYGRNTAAPLLFQIFDLLPAEPMAQDGVRTIANRHLAAGLKHFVAANDLTVFAAAHASPPRITYPPAGAHIEVARSGKDLAPLSLEAAGGSPPYRWAVNGQPLAPPRIGAPAAWVPDGPGFVRISVTDHFSRTATAEVWIE